MSVDAVYPSDQDLERFDETARALIIEKAKSAERGDYNTIVLLAREAEERAERPDLFEAELTKGDQRGKSQVPLPDRYGATVPTVDPEDKHGFVANKKEPSKCVFCGNDLGHDHHWEAPGQALLREATAKAAGDDKITVGTIRQVAPRLGTAYQQLVRLAEAWAVANNQLGDTEEILQRWLNTSAGRKALAQWPQAEALLTSAAPSATQKNALPSADRVWRQGMRKSEEISVEKAAAIDDRCNNVTCRVCYP